MKLSGVFIVFAVFLSALRSGIWSEPVYISEAGAAELTVDTSGVCWCITHDSLFSYHADLSRWLLESYTQGFGGFPCFDKENTLWVITANYTAVYYARYKGGNWYGWDTVPTYEYAYFGIPHITADSIGGVWVGWTTLERWYYHQANFNHYHNGKWEAPGLLSDTSDGGDHFFGAITTDALGRVWFAWTIPSRLVATYWDQSFWSDKTVILDMSDTLWALGTTIWLNLVPDHEGGVWAYFNYMTAKSIYVMASYWDGAEWSSPDTIALAGPFYGESPNDMPPWGGMAVDKYGNAWAVWRQAVVEKDSLGDIYYSVNKGSGWCEPAPVDVNPAMDIYANIAIDGGGRVWCVWASSRDSGGVWASYTTIDGVEEPPVTRNHPAPWLEVDQCVGREFCFRISNLLSPAELKIYDAGGRMVKELSVVSDEGVIWNGSDEGGKRLSAGVYFARIESGDPCEIGKITLLR